MPKLALFRRCAMVRGSAGHRRDCRWGFFRMPRRSALVLALLLGGCTTAGTRSSSAVEEVSLTALSQQMAAGQLSSEQTTRAYLERIATIDAAGPTLRSVLAVNPDALAQARTLDAERRAGQVRGALHGVPILLKDNVETRDPLPTTAGSLALIGNVTGRDAPIAARLRAGGAVILGKANLSEWANIRSTRSVSGWSAVGGLVRNPHALDRNACGSSSGSAAAAAASLAAATIGTETDGSIVCPASVNGVVGLKPTLGLVSRTGIVPISAEQDTAGPIARTVADAAAVLNVIAGSDPADPATAQADARKVNYVAGLGAGVRGVRIGVLRDRIGDNPDIQARFEAALAVLRAQGAELVDIAQSQPAEPIGEAEFTSLKAELRRDLDAYLADAPATVTTRDLRAVAAFNAQEPRETVWFGQEIFDQALAGPEASAPDARRARDTARRVARETLARLFADHRVTILVQPTTGPAWLSDPVQGDNFSGPSASQLPAVAGTPHLTVPMGAIRGLPIGLSFMGPAWSEASLLAAGHAYEQAAGVRPIPRYLPTVEVEGAAPQR